MQVQSVKPKRITPATEYNINIVVYAQFSLQHYNNAKEFLLCYIERYIRVSSSWGGGAGVNLPPKNAHLPPNNFVE